MKKLALVAPRYGAVEVWTTCATSHITWENVCPPGKTFDNGVIVRRFLVEYSFLAKQPVSNTETTNYPKTDDLLPPEYEWFTNGPHCPQMYLHIAQHGSEFDVIVPGPYTFTVAHYAAWLHPERTIFWPHLHHELQAFSEPTRLTLENVAGVIFNSPEGQELAIERLSFQIKNQICLGEGVKFDPAIGVGVPTHCVPHLLYIGRLEQAKNVPEMYHFMQLYAENIGAIHLTVAGKGPELPPDLPYIDFRGFVSDEEKAELYATSTAHWLPSLSESFSLVTMESWLSGRPALVNSKCYAPAGHIQRGKAGLAYSGFWEFAGAVQWLQENPLLATRMGKNGKQYVEQNYRWPIIVKRLEALVNEWIPD